MLIPGIRSRLEARFGKAIRYSKDCEVLAKSIEKNGLGRISVTTLKRLLGFAKDIEKPRLYTLDVLAGYLGYTDWSSLLADAAKPDAAISSAASVTVCEDENDANALQQQLVITYTTQSIDMSRVMALCRQFGKKPVITGFIIELINFAGKTKNLQFLKQLFTLPHVFNQQLHSQGQLYYIGQSLGIVLRSNPGLADELCDTYAKDPVAQLILIEWFVDEDYLNGYYGQLLDLYHLQRNKKIQDRIFYFSLKYTQCLHTGDIPGQQQYLKKLRSNRPGKGFHPIPAGRYYGICIAEDVFQPFNEQSDYYPACMHYIQANRYEDAITFLLFLVRYLYRKGKVDWISGLTHLFECSSSRRTGKEKTHWGVKIENQLQIYLAYGKYISGQNRKAREYISKADPNLFDAFMYKQIHQDYIQVASMIK